MGLRDEAERIIADQDARRAAADKANITAARAAVPKAIADWARGMGLNEVPDYTEVGPSIYCESDDAKSIHILLTFEVDSIGFDADLKYYLGRSKLRVRMDGGNGQLISTPADVATVLREQKARDS